MTNFRFVVLVFLFVGTAKINADQDDLIPRTLPDIGPRISLDEFLEAFGSEFNVPGIIIKPGSQSRPNLGSLIQIISRPNSQTSSPAHPPRPNSQTSSPAYPPRPNSQTSSPAYPPRPNSQASSPAYPPRVPGSPTVSNAGSKNPAKLPTPQEGCGFSPIKKSRIVGGVPAKKGSWPWMALLGYKRGGSLSFNCGGSLITARHVLSAAHCMNQALVMVRLGEHDLSTPNEARHEDVRVTRAEPHSGYDKNLSINDIAMLYLARDVKFTDQIRPVCLPISGALARKSFVASNPFVAGWGTLWEQGKLASVLMEVQVPVITNEDCRDSYRRIGHYKGPVQFSNRVICAGLRQGGKDSCQGDSGGPLMVPIQENGKFPYYQIGVVSYGVGCARASIPGVYASVQFYGDWIREKIRQ